MAEQVTININNGIALLTLNNPPLNLATLASTRQLNAALDDLAVDPALLVLVVTECPWPFNSTFMASMTTGSSSTM